MKKTLAMILALAMVSALCSVLFVSAEGTNLAAGKAWTGDTEIGTSYVGDLTDGLIEEAGEYDTTLWYGADLRKAEDDNAFTMIIDLGKSCDLDELRMHIWPAYKSGIVIPGAIDFYVSADGTNFEKVGTVSTFDSDMPQWVGVEIDETAQYVRYDMVGTVEGDTGVFWFVSELEAIGAEAAGGNDTPSEPEDEPSVDEPSVDEPSKEESETPATGDAGIIVFAVLGVVAIIGCAAVVKARG